MPNTQNTLESKLSSSPVPTLGVVPKKPKNPHSVALKLFCLFYKASNKTYTRKRPDSVIGSHANPMRDRPVLPHLLC
jgi:hypothetical protein